MALTSSAAGLGKMVAQASACGPRTKTWCLLSYAFWLLSSLSAAPQAARPPSGAEVIELLRAARLDEAECYRVRDLDLAEEDLRLYFNEGYFIFAQPILGERWAAIFSGDVEGGDAEALLLPPFKGERQSLAKFTQMPNLDEHFSRGLLLFTDDAAERLLDRISRGGRGKPAPEMGPLLAGQWNATLANIAQGFELRLAGDLLTPRPFRRGLLFATVLGKTLGAFDLFYDTRAGEQILAGRMTEHGGRASYDIWTSFPSRSTRNASRQAPSSSLSLSSSFAVERFEIQAQLDAGLRLKATVKASLKIGTNPVRGLPFDVSQAIEISAARIDGAPAELLMRESPRERALRSDENDSFLAIAAQPLAPGSAHQIEFEEEGSVIAPAGNDVFFVGARANWYPRSGNGFSLYDLSFQFPKRLTLVTPGDVVEDRVEGDWRYTRRVTPAPIRLAGFNLGDYEKVDGIAPGVRVEVYGNRSLEASLQKRAMEVAAQAAQTPAASAAGGLQGRRRRTPPPEPIAPPPPPDPLARLRSVAADVSSSLRSYWGWFGPPGLPSLTVAPIPAVFGQGFPGLVYLSTLAYLDPSARPEGARGPREQVFFSDLMLAHEVAHQWWGDLVVPATYQDEWIVEALANYSALLYLEKKKGVKAINDVLEDFRDILLRKTPGGVAMESVGPITLGYRLQTPESGDALHVITYDKGAWIFHMLRRRLGDERFFGMLAEFRRRYESRAVSTEDLRALVKEFLPPRVRPASVDTFFENWVYSTGIPALKLTYSAKGAAPSVRISGKIEQTGVDDDFSIEAPVEIDFAKTPSQTVWVETSSAGAAFSTTVRQVPSRVSIPIGSDVLARK